MSVPNSARDNLWRQAKAIADEEPSEAARIASELIKSSQSVGVQEEVARSCLAILSDAAVVEKKGPLCSFLSDLTRHPSSPACLMLMGEGVTTLAHCVAAGDDASKYHSLQALMNLGRSPGFHPEVVMALVEILRESEAPVKVKISVCRALNVISFYDNGQEILNIGGVTDVSRVLSDDSAKDSFAFRTLLQIAEGGAEEVVHSLLEVCNGGSKIGPYRSNLCRLLSTLSKQGKTPFLRSALGVRSGIPIVAEMLKEEEAGARAYACETLFNISKDDAMVTLPGTGDVDGEIIQEPVGCFVVAALIEVLASGESDDRVSSATMEKACRLINYVLTDAARGGWKTSPNQVFDEGQLISELAKVICECRGDQEVAACGWALEALLRGTRGLGKARKRRDMIKSRAAESLRYVLDEYGPKVQDPAVREKITKIMTICEISREVEEPELTRNIKIIMRNVDVNLSPNNESPYLAEKGERICRAMMAIRKAVSTAFDANLNANCREICESGVLQRMVVLLSNKASDKYPRLELETAWVITNIASGLSEFCVKLVLSGAVPAMVRLLNSPDAEVQDQALWGLANLAGDGAYCRDAIIEAGVVDAVVLAHQDGILANLKSMGDLAFLCRNILKTNPLPHINETRGVIPVLSAFLHRLFAPNAAERYCQVDYQDMVISTLHAFLGFTSQDESNELSMDIVMETGVLPIIVNFMETHIQQSHDGKYSGDVELLSPALKILNQFCQGSTEHTQHIIDIHGIDIIFKMTAMEAEKLRKVAWFAFSNMAAGSPEQVQELIKKGVYSRAYDVLTNTDWSIDKAGTANDDDFFLSENLSIKDDVSWVVSQPFETEEFTSEMKATMMQVLNCGHSQAGERKDADGDNTMYGIIAIFEAIHIFISSDIRGGDRNQRLELAMKLMKVMQFVTGPAMISPKINKKLKQKGKRIIAILQACLQQHSTNLSRLTETVCDQVLERIADA